MPELETRHADAAAPHGATPAMQIDFAHVVGERLFAYGWVVGLADSVTSAILVVGEFSIDLKTMAARVKRLDVSQHFQVPSSASDEHGFLVLIELPDRAANADTLRLIAHTQSGEVATNEWPIAHSEELALASMSAHEKEFRPLIPNMSHRQVRVLAGLGPRWRLSLRARDLEDAATNKPAHPRLLADVCCVIGGDILFVSGVLPSGLGEFTTLALHSGATRVDLLDGLVSIEPPAPAPGAAPHAGLLDRLQGRFVFVGRHPEIAASPQREARIHASGIDAEAVGRVQICTDAHEAWDMLQSHLAAFDANASVAILERVSGLLRALPAEQSLARQVSRELSASVLALPMHLDAPGPVSRVHFYIDMALPIADAGIYVVGWFDADARHHARVTCRAGNAEFCVSDQWVRWSRADVTAHLASLGGEHGDMPGFHCFVPLPPSAQPCYVTVTIDDSPTLRLRLQLPAAADSVPKAIRAVLSTLDPNRQGLRRMLDDHVGPAIGALWASRLPPRQTAQSQQFGPEVVDPWVSVIVPLFGRYDFADYQLALFADDPDFQHVELIYIVDDPSIVDAFRRQCPDLYALHGVPFRFAYPGANLGFAGVNNFAAKSARAEHLLLLNSDVFPRQPGWLSAMLKTYRAHPDTGLLGTKLLFEDGTVQHAGMASERHAPWHDLWINAHPHKGMSPVGLDGLRKVEGVTAACVLIETALYRRLGGFSEDYVIGDFEDSDLCHRARELGRPNRVALDIVLYHLERQSQALAGDAPWRTALTLYNCWLHDRRWGQALAREAQLQ